MRNPEIIRLQEVTVANIEQEYIETPEKEN